MANKVLPTKLRKNLITLRLSQYVIDELKKQDGYMVKVEEALIKEFNIEKPNVEE